MLRLLGGGRTRVLGLSRRPLMVPTESYEIEGFRPGVIFPTGAILETNGQVIYYGSADTVICVATARLEDLLALCEPLDHVSDAP